MRHNYLFGMTHFIENDLFNLLGERIDCGAGLGPQLLMSNGSMTTHNLWASVRELGRRESSLYIFIKKIVEFELNEKKIISFSNRRINAEKKKI